MSGAKQTPGPWQYCEEAIRPDGPVIPYVFRPGQNLLITDLPKPDLTLISAAPDLLAACRAIEAEQRNYAEKVEEDFPGNGHYSERFMAVVRMARAAIAKATGTEAPR